MKKVLIVLPLVIAMTACSSFKHRTSVELESPKLFTKDNEVQYPDWYVKGAESDDKGIYSVASEYSSDFQFSVDKSMLSAKRELAANFSSYISAMMKDFATERARDWFGGFTPMVNFPSLVDIEEQLTREIEQARMKVWRTDQTLLSDAFLKIFGSLSETTEIDADAESLKSNIQELFNELEQSPLIAESRINYAELREKIDRLTIEGNTDITALRVLKIYIDTLQGTLNVQKESFEGIQKYLQSVNEFFDHKALVFRQDTPIPRRQSIQIRFEDGTFLNGLRSLSSGERQIMTLVYAATHMSQQEIVLIDEPEISLHVDWQRMLIKRMAEQLGERQIIACTHSPVIGADHFENIKELSLSPTKAKFKKIVEEEDIPF